MTLYSAKQSLWSSTILCTPTKTRSLILLGPSVSNSSYSGPRARACFVYPTTNSNLRRYTSTDLNKQNGNTSHNSEELVELRQLIRRLEEKNNDRRSATTDAALTALMGLGMGKPLFKCMEDLVAGSTCRQATGRQVYVSPHRVGWPMKARNRLKLSSFTHAPKLRSQIMR
jgi:hypothetical protein